MKTPLSIAISAATLTMLAGCNVEQGSASNNDDASLLANGSSTEFVVQDDIIASTSALDGKAQVNFRVEFPESAAGSVILDDTFAFDIYIHGARYGRWDEFFSNFGFWGGEGGNGIISNEMENIIAVSSGDFYVDDIIDSWDLVNISLNDGLSAASLSLIPGNYLIEVVQRGSNGTYSRASILAELTEGQNNVSIPMLAGTWDFTDGSGNPQPLQLELMDEAKFDLDGLGDLDAVSEVQPWLGGENGSHLLGLHLFHEGSGYAGTTFDAIYLRKNANGLEQETRLRPFYYDDFDFGTMDILGFAGLFQEYYKDGAEEVNQSRFYFGASLYEKFIEESVNQETGAWSETGVNAYIFTTDRSTEQALRDIEFGGSSNIDDQALEFSGAWQGTEWGDWGEEQIRYLGVEYVRSLSGSDIDLSGATVNQTKAQSGTRIEGTMMQLVEQWTYSSEQVDYIAQPELPEEYRSDDSLGNGSWGSFATAAQNYRALQDLAVSTGLLAEAVNETSCAQLTKVSQYTNDARYYWDTETSVWVIKNFLDNARGFWGEFYEARYYPDYDQIFAGQADYTSQNLSDYEIEWNIPESINAMATPVWNELNEWGEVNDNTSFLLVDSLGNVIVADYSDGWVEVSEGSNDTWELDSNPGVHYQLYRGATSEEWNAALMELMVAEPNTAAVLALTGKYCIDTDQNGCHFSSYGEYFDLNNDGIIQALESKLYEPELAIRGGNNSDTYICWQDFVLEGRTLDSALFGANSDIVID